MIKELMHNLIFLAVKSDVATKEVLSVAYDLLDTLMAHRESSVGMAAIMSAIHKRIIAFLDESGRFPTYTMILNLVIIACRNIRTQERMSRPSHWSAKSKQYKTIKV